MVLFFVHWSNLLTSNGELALPQMLLCYVINIIIEILGQCMRLPLCEHSPFNPDN